MPKSCQIHVVDCLSTFCFIFDVLLAPVAIYWETAALLAFRLCYFMLDAVLDACVPVPFDVIGKALHLMVIPKYFRRY